MTLEQYANEIEEMDFQAQDICREEVDKIISQYCDQFNPDNELSVSECVIKMGLQTAKKLYDELVEFRY